MNYRRVKGTPITNFELSLAKTVSAATFPVASSPKRFIGDICNGHIKLLTDRGRWYLAFVANRFRRQYNLSQEQWQWVFARLSPVPPTTGNAIAKIES